MFEKHFAMPAERLRLRAWIEKEADGGKLPGLEWEDRDKGIFKVSWKHASRQCWSFPKDACVFEGWAIHSGRYRKGYDRPDPRRWKANFRCALNALPDIVELPNQGIARGQDAYKVYQIVRKSTKKDGHNKRHSKCKYWWSVVLRQTTGGRDGSICAHESIWRLREPTESKF